MNRLVKTCDGVVESTDSQTIRSDSKDSTIAVKSKTRETKDSFESKTRKPSEKKFSNIISNDDSVRNVLSVRSKIV